MTISSIGVGSNLDLAGLLEKLQAEESKPLQLLVDRSKSYTSKLTGYGQIQSALSNLKAAAAKLGDPSLFAGVKGALSATDVLSATMNTGAVGGTYAINVTQIAKAQSLVAPGQASAKTAIGIGTVTIDFGTIAGGTLDPVTGKYTGAGFTPDADRAAVPITIDASNNTLEGIRDAINKAKAGVTASIVNDGSGTPNRLVLTSNETGVESSMRISVAGDPALQAMLNHDPAGTQNLQQTVAAQDAKLVVNNIAITSATNSVKDAVPGTTLTLVKDGATTLTLTKDTASMETAIADLVKAYNALQATAGTLTAFDKEKETAGPLLGDSTLRNLLSRVRETLTAAQPGGSGDIKVLSAIGVAIQKDGTLSIDSDKLKAALGSNLDGVAKLFSSATTETTGYGKQLSAMVDTLTGTGGALKVATDGINTTLKDIDKQYADMEDRVSAKVERYRAQFTELDLLVAKLNNTQKYLTQQFEAMSAQK